ncbi:11239_t:CDS:2 [Paraglomus occultum]|uniref:11239_t:CDS:1 n=1 Tax=Paraglomus occultum TaxID=144539 RepID=A0A9N9AB22_9GLOM|nr:11239_t:CDS:2 [Paraglomus occultum]
MRFFAKDKPLVQNQAIIIIDEASRLTSNDNEQVITEFIDSLRTLKGDRDNFRLYSLLLCGTASIRDLLLARQRPGSMSSISPFSGEASLTCNRFTEAEVHDLFTQFAKCNNSEFDAANIAVDIFLSHPWPSRNDEDAKYLLAEGMIFVKRELDNGCWETEISAPILRSLIISPIVLPDISISKVPLNATTLDPRWLLARTTSMVFNECLLLLINTEAFDP